MLLPTLRPPDWPDRAGCRPLLVDGPPDLPVVSVGPDGVDPERVDPPCRTVPASSGHVVLDFAGRGAAEQVLSETRLRAIGDRLDTAALVVCLPHPDRLLVSTPHPVAVATLEGLGGAAFDAVARVGGPALSRRLLLVVDGRLTGVFEPGTLAARRAVGVAGRKGPGAVASTPPDIEPPPPPPAGVMGWLRRLAGG